MVKTCLLLVAGGLAAQHSTALLPNDVLCALLPAATLALASRRSRPLALVILGAVLFQLAGARIVEARLDARYAGDSMMGRVRIADFPRQSGNTVTMSVVPLDDPRIPQRVRLSWYEPPVVPRIGETWELEMRLRRPRGSLNPDGFDVETWLFREGYHATGYVVASKRNRLLWSGGATGVDEFRARFITRVRAAAGSTDAAAVLAAVGVGARHLLSPDQWGRFAETGTSHLMAISGLHVGLAALAGFVLVFGIAIALPGLDNHYVAAMLLGIAIAGGYALVSGLGVPSRRALIMLVAAAVAVMRRRQIDSAVVVSLAAGLVFVTDPIATLTPGFHLSFAAVLVLLWLARFRGAVSGRIVGPVRRLLAMQVFLMFGLLPLTAFLFGRFAILAVPVNLVAVPVFSLVTVPLTLAAGIVGFFCEAASIALLRLAGWSVTAVDRVVDIAAASSPIDGTLAGIEGMAWLFLGLPLAWVALPRSWPGRHVAVLGVVALATWKPPLPPETCFDAWILDVGQGLSVAVVTQGDLVLYDTGMAWRSGATAAEHVVLPFLDSRGIDRISRLVISHADLDHSGGTDKLLRRVHVGHVLAGEPLLGVDVLQCAQGQNWRSGTIRFEILHPPPRPTDNGNNASCVLRVSTGRHSLLLTGDIETEAEYELLNSGAQLGADVVVVPHHGSRTSSSGPFVDAVRPTAAVVSAGHANRWGFPDSQVVNRWRAAGARLFNTADNGAVSARICAASGVVELVTERQRRRRFWHDEN